jgi:hypothetical protein
MAHSLGVVMPIASQVGVTLEEVAAQLSALTLAGLDTALATTQMRSAMVTMLKPAKGVQDQMEALGVDISRSAVQSKGFVRVLRDIEAATRGNEDAIARLFPNIRAMSGIFALTGNQADDFDRILNNIQESVGIVDEQFQKFTNTAQFRVRQALNAMRIELTQSLGGEIVDALDTAITEAGGPEALMGDARLLGEVVGQLIGKAIVEVSKLIGKLNELFDKLGGVDKISDVIKRVTDVILDALKLVFVALQDLLQTQITAITLLVQTLIQTIDSIPGVDLGLDSAESMKQQIFEKQNAILDINAAIQGWIVTGKHDVK